MANLICLGVGIENAPILARARALGHTVIAVDGNPDAPGFAHAAVRVVASCYHTEQVLPALGYALNTAGLKPDGVLCAGVDAPHVAAAVASAYGLPGLTPEAARLSVDKIAQKWALNAVGLPVPRFGELEEGGYLTFASRHPDKVLKPVDSRGARGVQLMRFGESDKFGVMLDAAIKASPTGRVMAEEYLPGPQLSTESAVIDGKVLFTAVALRNYDRLAEFAPAILEDGIDNWMPAHDATGLWRDNLLREIDDLITRACAALNWRNLTVKGDLIIHGNKPVILELAARLSGGFFSTHFIPLAFGVPIVDYAIHLALGETVEAPTWGHKQFVCQRYIFPAPGDIGRRVVSVPKIQCYCDGPLDDDAYIVDAGFATYAVRPGDVLRPVTDHGARLGQAIATGSTPEQARERAEAAVKAMQAALVLE